MFVKNYQVKYNMFYVNVSYTIIEEKSSSIKTQNVTNKLNFQI